MSAPSGARQPRDEIRHAVPQEDGPEDPLSSPWADLPSESESRWSFGGSRTETQRPEPSWAPHPEWAGQSRWDGEPDWAPPLDRGDLPSAQPSGAGALGIPAQPAPFTAVPAPASVPPFGHTGHPVGPVSGPPISAPPMSAPPLLVPPVVSGRPLSVPPVVSGRPVSAPPVPAARQPSESPFAPGRQVSGPPLPASRQPTPAPVASGSPISATGQVTSSSPLRQGIAGMPRAGAGHPSQGVAEPAAGRGDGPGEGTDLPRRVPARPDVPDVPGDPDGPDGIAADAPDLSRIASYLSSSRTETARVERDESDIIDIGAVLQAVRAVPGVREAHMRPNRDGVHTLRLELADEASPAQVSRVVAQLLNERMGLAAKPNDPALAPAGGAVSASGAGAYSPQYRRRRSAPVARPLAEQQHGEWNAGVGQQADPQRWAGGSGAQAELGRTMAMPTVGGQDQGVTTTANGLPGDPGTVLTQDARHRNLGEIPPPASSQRVIIDQVKVTDEGFDALVEVRLIAGERQALGVASGPAYDGYVLRLAAAAAATAIDHLIDTAGRTRARCFVEHATVVALGGASDVAVVVVLLAGEGWVDQLSGSAVVAGDPRHAVVRATLAAVSRRLDAML